MYGRTLPNTSVPSPGDYARIYDRLAINVDGIISIHLSPRYNSAIHAAVFMKDLRLYSLLYRSKHLRPEPVLIERFEPGRVIKNLTVFPVRLNESAAGSDIFQTPQAFK